MWVVPEVALSVNFAPSPFTKSLTLDDVVFATTTPEVISLAVYPAGLLADQVFVNPVD